jgi:hypothetical protein
MFFVLKFELILIIGSNKVLTEGTRKSISQAPRWTGLLYNIANIIVIVFYI